MFKYGIYIYIHTYIYIYIYIYIWATGTNLSDSKARIKETSIVNKCTGIAIRARDSNVYIIMSDMEYMFP